MTRKCRGLETTILKDKTFRNNMERNRFQIRFQERERRKKKYRFQMRGPEKTEN
jgi:hypothetical protein